MDAKKVFTKHWLLDSKPSSEAGKKTGTLSDGREVGFLYNNYYGHTAVVGGTQIMANQTGRFDEVTKAKLEGELAKYDKPKDKKKILKAVKKYLKWVEETYA